MADSNSSQKSKCLCLTSFCFSKKQSSPLKPRENSISRAPVSVGVNSYNNRIGRPRVGLRSNPNNFVIRE